MLVIFTEPTRTAKPRERAFHDPAAWQHLEMTERFRVLDDLQPGSSPRAQSTHPLDEFTCVSPVGPDAAQPAKSFAQRGEHQTRTVAVLHVCRMDAHQEDQSQGVDQKMSLSSRHLFSSVVSTNSALLSCSHTLRVENRSRRGFFFPAWSRTASRSASLSRAQTPCFFQCAK